MVSELFQAYEARGAVGKDRGEEGNDGIRVCGVPFEEHLALARSDAERGQDETDEGGLMAWGGGYRREDPTRYARPIGTCFVMFVLAVMFPPLIPLLLLTRVVGQRRGGGRRWRR